MADLISPGVSVTITDRSFYIPATATTVPTYFIATADEKKQPDGVTDAPGTFEHDVIRTVTSVRQSTQLYGVPRFLEDETGSPLHGDVRNEYGLFGLNQFLGVASRAYVIRANVNLNDNLSDIRASWDTKLQESSYILENIANVYINEYNVSNGYIPSDPNYKQTVTLSQLQSLVTTATQEVWRSFSFKNSRSSFMTDSSSNPLVVYADGYNNVPTGMFNGFNGMAQDWVNNGSGSVVPTEWTPQEAGSLLLGAADDFKYTVEFLNQTSLGANDAARRVAVVTALQAAINSNQDIRSELYEYNLIVCPGFPEVADELLQLSVDINEEAFVVSDTPFNMDPDQVVQWAGTVERRSSSNIAYYYPHGIASNLDGKNVFIAASGIAMRTIAYSDEVGELWSAPAGTQRGSVSGVDRVGYVSGTIGTANTFVEVALNRGQRDNLYKDFTNINPIVFFPGRGIIVFGQKTSATATSALDRINVVRMLMYVKRSLRKSAMPFVFEANVQTTRDSLKAMADGFLSTILNRGGIVDFASLCDASNNTPAVVDQHQMILEIAIKPTLTAEFIMIPITVVAQGAEL